MKKIFKSLLVISSLLLVGCEKNESSIINSDSTIITDSTNTADNTTDNTSTGPVELEGTYTYSVKNKLGSAFKAVTVTLTYGDTVLTKNTNVKGQATFANLMDVNYTISFSNLPEHFFIKQEKIPTFDKETHETTIYLSSELLDADEFDADKTTYKKGSVMCDFSTEYIYTENETVKTETFTLSESLKTHKAVIINVWATWCSPCKSEMPHFETLMKDYGDKVDLIAIDCDSDETQQDVLDFKDENKYTFKMSVDNKEITNAILANSGGSIPVTVIVDQEGFIATYQIGAVTSYSSWKKLISTYID